MSDVRPNPDNHIDEITRALIGMSMEHLRAYRTNPWFAAFVDQTVVTTAAMIDTYLATAILNQEKADKQIRILEKGQPSWTNPE